MFVVCPIAGAFCYAELGTVIKESGADYSYLHAAFGPVVSYTFSWVNNILIKPAGVATVLLTCAQYVLVPLFDDGCGQVPGYIAKTLAIAVLSEFIVVTCNTKCLMNTSIPSRRCFLEILDRRWHVVDFAFIYSLGCNNVLLLRTAVFHKHI